MVGLDAITHNNGWTIAITGAGIVFSGLATLAFAISQLHKLIGLLDRSPMAISKVREEKKLVWNRPDCPNNIEMAVRLYQPIIETLPPEFDLADLYQLAQKHHLPHPHLSIRCLRDSGRLISNETGLFHFIVPDITETL